MGNPSPFDIGRAVGDNFGNAFTKQRDNSAIESIITEAMNSGDPKVLQNSIGKMLSQVSAERQGPAIQYLQNAYNNVQQKQKEQKLEELGREAAKQGKYTYGAPPQVQAQEVRNQQPQKPVGGITAQEIPENISQSIQDVIKNNPTATADDLGIAFAQAKVPIVYSNSYVENRRRKDESKANNQIENVKTTRKEELEFHKESQKYDDELLKQTKTAKSQVQTLKNIEEAVNSGNIRPSSLTNIFKGMGNIGNKISEAILNKDEATLLTSIPQLLDGWKEFFGVRLSDADLKLLQDKLPTIGKSPESNKKIINILGKYAELTLLRGQLASQIKEENNGLRPLGYAEKVEKRFDEMTAPIKIINPQTGNEIEIPAYKLSDAMRAGAILADLGKEYPAGEELANPGEELQNEQQL